MTVSRSVARHARGGRSAPPIAAAPSSAAACVAVSDTADVAPIGLKELTGGGPVMILAPHADDESLGCGGLIAAARAQGVAVHVICMTDGAASHPNSHAWGGGRLTERREAEMIRALAHLGCAPDSVRFLRHPDGWLGAQDGAAIGATLADLCAQLRVRTLLASSGIDHHADHKATAAIAAHMTRHHPELRHWAYPVWSRWDDAAYLQAHGRLRPRSFDTSDWQSAKRRAIDAHDSQLGRIVEDDPAGFAMPGAFVEFFATAPEIFFEVPSCP